MHFQPVFVNNDQIDLFYEQIDIDKIKSISKIILYDKETGRIYFIESPVCYEQITQIE